MKRTFNIFNIREQLWEKWYDNQAPLESYPILQRHGRYLKLKIPLIIIDGETKGWLDVTANRSGKVIQTHYKATSDKIMANLVLNSPFSKVVERYETILEKGQQTTSPITVVKYKMWGVPLHPNYQDQVWSAYFPIKSPEGAPGVTKPPQKGYFTTSGADLDGDMGPTSESIQNHIDKEKLNNEIAGEYLIWFNRFQYQ